MLHTIGFDKVYERAEGAYFWDAEGNDYLDMLAGFGVMGLGRHHPVVRKALHDVLDASLADLTRFDCQPLPGLLAEKLLAHSPHLDRVFFGNSGTEAVETALKFARYATGKPRVLYCDHAFHGLTTGSLSVNGEDGFRDGFAPLLPDTADRARRSRRAGAGAEARRRGRLRRRAHPGQGRARGAARLPARRPGAAAPAQGAADRRRGADRPRQDRRLLRLPARGRASSRTWSASRRRSPAATSRSARPSARTGSSRRSTRRWTGSWSTRRASAPTPRPWRPGSRCSSVMEDEQIVANARAHRRAAARPARRARRPATSCCTRCAAAGLMIGIEFGRPDSLKLRSRWTMLQAARKGLFAQMVVVPLLQKHRILTQVSGDHLEVIKLIPPLIIGEREVDRFVERLHGRDGRRARRWRADVGLRQDPGEAGGRQPLSRAVGAFASEARNLPQRQAPGAMDA